MATFSVQDVFVAARSLGCKTPEAAMIAMMKVEGHGFAIDQRTPEKLRAAVQKRSLRWAELMPIMPGISRTEVQARLWFKAALGHKPIAEIETAAGYGEAVVGN